MEETKKFVDKNFIAKLLFFGGFLTLLFVDYVSATYVSLPFSGRLQQLALVLFFGKILLTRYSFKEWIAIALLFAVGVCSYLSVGSYMVCELFLLVIAAKDVDKRTAVRMYLILIGVISLLAAGAAISEIFGEISITYDFRGNGAETRYCFGYNHPNTCQIIFIQLGISFVWLFYEKLKWFHLLILGVLNGILGIFTDSRTGLLLGTVVFFALAICKAFPMLAQIRVVHWLNYITLAGSLLLSYLAVKVGIANSILQMVNKAWTGRVQFAHDAALLSNPSLFSGGKLQISCDMGHVYLFYNYGVLFYVLFLALLVYQLYRNAGEKNVAELAVLFVGLIFLLGERFSSGDYMTRNILVIFMIGLWPSFLSGKE